MAKYVLLILAAHVLLAQCALTETRKDEDSAYAARRGGDTGYTMPMPQGDSGMPDFPWKAFPFGHHTAHQPWVQPAMPKGPIIFPTGSSLGGDYGSAMLPAPLLPFANDVLTNPTMPERSKSASYLDWTASLAPPIFLEEEENISVDDEEDQDETAPTQKFSSVEKRRFH